MDFMEKATAAADIYQKILSALQRLASQELREAGVCENPLVVSWRILPDGRFSAEYTSEDDPMESETASFLAFRVEREVSRLAGC